MSMTEASETPKGVVKTGVKGPSKLALLGRGVAQVADLSLPNQRISVQIQPSSANFVKSI